jgi:hypothetical protein
MYKRPTKRRAYAMGIDAYRSKAVRQAPLDKGGRGNRGLEKDKSSTCDRETGKKSYIERDVLYCMVRVSGR